MSDWQHQQEPGTSGGPSTGHLHNDLLLDLHRHLVHQTGMLSTLQAEFRGHVQDTRARLARLERNREQKMHKKGLMDFIGYLAKAGPWLVPIALFIRAVMGQVPWANFFEALARLGSGGIGH